MEAHEAKLKVFIDGWEKVEAKVKGISELTEQIGTLIEEINSCELDVNTTFGYPESSVPFRVDGQELAKATCDSVQATLEKRQCFEKE